MNFTEKVIQLEAEAKSYILSKLKDGERLELISPDQIEEEGNDAILDLPQAHCENRYNQVDYYAIVAIERKGESLDLYGRCIGENWGESYIFTPYELTANELCWVADFLK
jgi:hypothetical protein